MGRWLGFTSADAMAVGELPLWVSLGLGWVVLWWWRPDGYAHLVALGEWMGWGALAALGWWMVEPGGYRRRV